MRDRLCLALALLSLVVLGLFTDCVRTAQPRLQDAPRVRYALTAGHPGCCTWSGTRDCNDGTGKRCCAKCPRRCGW
jgi:hypothetical protein